MVLHLTMFAVLLKWAASAFTSKAGGFRILSRIRLGIEIWNEQVFSNFKGGKLLGTSVPNKPLKGRENERRTCGTASECWLPLFQTDIEIAFAGTFIDIAVRGHTESSH